ncbi:FtsX-like permease family protein [Streptomyces sp. NPDC023327]|uniref:ABC transporter permease n=1 Tax=Streptomyces sp. NPDC023327 TaxID=3157088 RepID=UPI0033D3733A
MLKATLRSFLAHKGRLVLSALAVILSVAFVAGSLIFSDTVSRTFDRLFASTSADVMVAPKDELEEALPSGRTPTVPAGLKEKVAKVIGVADAHIDVSVQNVTVVDRDNESVGSTTGAPTVATNWYPTDRSPVELTSGHAPRGAGQAMLDADTADRKDVGIGDTLLGLLRALGADRRQVRRSVLIEALLLGLLGSTLGLAAGIGLALGLIELMGLLGMNLKSTEMVVTWATPVASYVVGVGVTFVAAYLPARRAAHVSPMAALADAEIAGVGRPLKVRAVAGCVVGVAGAAALAGCAAADETSSAASFLGLGIVLTLVATVVAGPLLVRPVIRVLGGAFPAVFGSVGRMSQRNALRNPRRTGATAAALMVGLALVGGLSVASASMTASFDRRIDEALGADFVVQNSNFMPFSPEVTGKIEDTDGAGLVVRQRFSPLELALPDGRHVESTAAGYDPRLDDIAHVTYTTGNSRAALAPGHLGMDREFAHKHRVRVGDVLTATFPGGREAKLTVGAFTDQGSPEGFGVEGGLFLGLGTLEKYVPDGQDSAVYVNASAGTDAGTLRARLEKTLDPYPQVQVRDQADYKELVRQQIAVMLYLVYALLGLAIVIAVLGVVNTLALSVVERTREIGLLRAIGLGRRQLRRMIRLESVVIAVFGALLGLALGLVWGVAAQQVLALQGMAELAFPWTTIVAVVVGSVVVGLVAALLPALRASRMNVLSAIAHE